MQTGLQRGANLSRIMSGAHRLRPDFDARQINTTYFSALGGDEGAYLAARLIQLFAPGVPQIYYVGLLAGENDFRAVEEQGDKRAINRHNYSLAELELVLQKPVVQRLLACLRFRNRYPAFRGDFGVLSSADYKLRPSWKRAEAECELHVHLREQRFSVRYRRPNGRWANLRLEST